MPKPDNQFQKLAEEARERVERAHEAGQQLAFLPPDRADDAEEGGRGKGKRSTALAAYMRAQGYRDPLDVLAEMAGLSTQLDPFTAALARVEQVQLALGTLSTGQKLGLFTQIYAMQLRAADAVAPYLHAKAEKAPAPLPAVQIYMQQPAAQPGDGAKVVNQVPLAPGQRVQFAPPPMPSVVEQNQEDSE